MQKVPAYNLQHAFITYGDLRAHVIEAVDVLDNHVSLPISNRSFNILRSNMRYSIYAVLEVCLDNNSSNNDVNDNDNNEVKVQENNNDKSSIVPLMMNRTVGSSASTNRIRCYRNEQLSIKEEFIFEDISSVYHFIIKFYLTSWCTNDTSSVITSLRSIKNASDHSYTTCNGFTKIPLYRLQENQKVSRVMNDE